MSIQLTTPMSAIVSNIAEQIKRQQYVLVRRLLYCAEEITNAARQTKSYEDQTGNLRSSLGCVVAIDGNVVGEYGFDVIKKGHEGAEEGKQYVRELAAQYPKGIVLIAVAGKKYAVYVSAKGKDVLDSAELLADKLVPEYLKELGYTK